LALSLLVSLKEAEEYRVKLEKMREQWPSSEKPQEE
jgi:hypothetical protein